MFLKRVYYNRTARRDAALPGNPKRRSNMCPRRRHESYTLYMYKCSVTLQYSAKGKDIACEPFSDRQTMKVVYACVLCCETLLELSRFSRELFGKLVDCSVSGCIMTPNKAEDKPAGVDRFHTHTHDVALRLVQGLSLEAICHAVSSFVVSRLLFVLL